MSDDIYYVCYLADIYLRDVAEILRRCQKQGYQPEDGNLDAGVQKIRNGIEGTGTGLLDLWDNDTTKLGLTFNIGEQWDWNDPSLIVTVSMMDLDPNADTNMEEQSQRRVKALTDLTADLVEVLEPDYVWGMPMVGPDPDVGRRPTDKPISENIQDIGWITVLSPQTIENLGGREYVLDTPAWCREELSTGHVMILTADNPVDLIEYPEHSPKEYLLRKRTSTDSVLKGATQQSLQDPFQRFSPGEIGADVVIDKRTVGGEISNEDLELKRVELYENDRLWDIETGEFVRRVYGTSAQLGTLPPAVEADDEKFPPLALADVPLEFVQLDDPTDENVITKVMALDVDVDKFELLVRLASTLNARDYDQSDIDTVETVLDHVSDLEEVGGIDAIIKKALL